MEILRTIIELFVLGAIVLGCTTIVSIFWFSVWLKVTKMDIKQEADFFYCTAMAALSTACAGIVTFGLFLNFFV